MNTESLQLLVEVSQLGSFAAVARKHDMDPSSVSRTVSALEQELNLRLFQRTTRHLELTEAGEIYLKRISPLLDELHHALDDAHKVSSEPNGTLRMTASVAFGQMCLLPHLDAFRQCYPEIRLELQLTDEVVDLITGSIDLACRLAPRSGAELIGTKLFDTRYRVCASPDYVASMPDITHPDDLTDHKCLVFTLPEYRSRWLFRRPGSVHHEVPIQSDISISSALALRECALSGLGPALLADWLIDKDIAEGRLVAVLPDYEVTAENFDTSAWCLYPSRSFLPTKTRAMIDFLRSKYPTRID